MLTFNQKLKQICVDKNNRIRIGIDVDNEKLSNPSLSYMEGYIKDIIDCTIDHCPIYKINFSFYEKHGSSGYKILEKIPDFINGRAITIADAKRGDIGNTSKNYADSVFSYYNFDAITISPYMGRDAIEPFIKNPDKGVFILSVTSNPSARELQEHGGTSNPLYKKVIQLAVELNQGDNIGLVVGATQIAVMEDIRKQSKGMPWLIPGVGFQGGDLETALNISHKHGMGIINVSRSIIYAGNQSLDEIRNAAINYNEQINKILEHNE